MKLLITGATGFIGSAITARLVTDGYEVVATHRGARPEGNGIQWVEHSGLAANADWSAALQGVEAIVHSAARVHVMRDSASDPLAEYRATNRDGTLNLATQAAAAGVKRFIFLSTIKVNGESTDGRAPFRADDTPAPSDPYAISKFEAEQGLQQIAARTGMGLTILRPPLVYGPGVKGNFATLVKLVARRLPLPLAASTGKRSFVALDNLVDLVALCVTHPQASGKTLLVADAESLTPAEWVRHLGTALGKPARVIPLPVSLLTLAAFALRKPKAVQKLTAALEVDAAPTTELLGWKPPLTVDQALARLADSLRKN
jgi:nucleoside-diphosphate-sugar epimerase